jgi:hypothetical protein
MPAMIVGRAFMITEKFMIGCLNKLKNLVNEKYSNTATLFFSVLAIAKKEQKRSTDKTKTEFVAELMARMTVDEKIDN